MGRTKTTRVGPFCNGHNRDGSPCAGYPCVGRTKCRQHGGETPKGTRCANYGHGKYSADLPDKCAADYLAAISDPEIHALTHEIGVIEARYRQLMRRAETGDLGHAWITLDANLQAFLEADDTMKRGDTLKALEHTVKRGANDFLLWQTLQDTTKLLSTLRLQEHRRIVDLQLVLTQQQAQEFLAVIKQALYESVTMHAEASIASAILADMQTRVAKLLPPVRGPTP